MRVVAGRDDVIDKHFGNRPTGARAGPRWFLCKEPSAGMRQGGAYWFGLVSAIYRFFVTRTVMARSAVPDRPLGQGHEMGGASCRTIG